MPRKSMKPLDSGEREGQLWRHSLPPAAYIDAPSTQFFPSSPRAPLPRGGRALLTKVKQMAPRAA